MICDKCGWYQPDGDGTNVEYYTACKSGFPPEKRKKIVQDVMDGLESKCKNFERYRQ